jgi:hypothetical protein
VYERITADARFAMRAANQEAMRVSHDYIGGDDILIGTAPNTDGTVSDVLALHNLTVSKLRDCLSGLPRTERPFESRAKPAFFNAMKRARELYHLEVNSAHLLLELLDCPSSDACRALIKAGVAIEKMKEDVLARLPPGSPEEVAHRLRLEETFRAHPEVVALKQEIAKLQTEKESSIASGDFDSAASVLGRQELLRDSLDKPYQRLSVYRRPPRKDCYATFCILLTKSRPDVAGGSGFPSCLYNSMASSTISHSSANTFFSSLPWQPP